MSNELRQIAEQNKILEIRHGSHLYGTSTHESDEDFVGVFMPTADYVFGLKSVQEIDLGTVDKGEDGRNTADAVDRKLYEFRKFLTLCLANNPNILEVLFVNNQNIVFCNETGKSLLAIREYFPSKLCIPKFIGYANAQKHKMIIKKDHYIDLVAAHDILGEYDDKHTMSQILDMEGTGGIFFKKDRGMHIHCGDICFEPGVYVKKARKKLKERIDKATNRSDLILKYGYDTKFASHLIRLLSEGIEILETSSLEFPLKNADLIKGIKAGDMKLNEVLKLSDSMEEKIDEIKVKSSLRKKPDYDKIEEFCMVQMILHSTSSRPTLSAN